ncbi:hypothetical protein BGX26_009380 [Mortierella sp. AD094]|nr:hypothetical protein BGX26_009380 [Mortierella sp. AD094]
MSIEHTHFLEDFLDRYPLSTLREAHRALRDTFPDLGVSLSTVYSHVKDVCEYTLKRIRKISDRRNDADILDQREAFAERTQGEILEQFRSKTVFIDEAGFNLHLIREYGWSK